MATGTKTPLASRRNSPMCKTAFDLARIGWGLGLWVLKIAWLGTRRNHEGVCAQGSTDPGESDLLRSAKTLEGALARAVNGDFDGYDTDAAESIDWRVALASIEENT
jgi:hypothetical protein